MPLNDKEIRPNCINFLNTCSNKPNKVIEELPVSYGSAIADVVGIYNTLHCYEIKGETDTVQRIQKQGEFYNKSFPLITLVTTVNHLEYALKSAPYYWGIILAKSENGTTTFSIIRDASKNPDFSGEEALHTLWKNELLSIPQKNTLPIKDKMSKRMLSEILSQNLSETYIAEYISSTVKNRSYSKKSLYI